MDGLDLTHLFYILVIDVLTGGWTKWMMDK